VSTEITQVLVVGRTSPPGQAVTLTDHVTNTVIGSTVSDAVTGIWSIPCPFGIYLEAIAEAHGAAGAAVGGSQPGTAGGQGGAGGTLTQAQPLAGAAGGAATGGASALGQTGGGTQALSGSAGGKAAGGASALGVVTPDTTAPAIQAFGVQDTTGTSMTGIEGEATDAVGIVGWMIKERAADSGWTAPAAGDAGWNSLTSTTTFHSHALTFTSSATATGTRFFRLYVKDAAGNVAGSSTSSCTITIAAGGSISLVGTPVSGTGSGSAITLPSGRQAGDIIVVVASANAAITNYTRKINDGNLGVFWRRATADASDNCVVAGSVEYACSIYRGCVASGDPFEAASSSVATSDTTGSALSVPQITTATNGAWVLAAASGFDGGWDDGGGGSDANSGPTWAAASGAAATLDANHSSVVDMTANAAGLWHSTKATAGATGACSVRFYMTGYNYGAMGTSTWGALLALKPA
jgi:hypothetical protein